MTEDQIRDGVLVLILLGVVAFVFGSLYMRAYQHYKQQGLKKFDQYLDSLKGNRASYELFTSGHPQVWCTTTEEELKRGIISQCLRVSGAGMPIPSPSNYLLHADEGRKAVYVVFGDGRNFAFDWSSLVHYEDYVPKDKQYTIRVR